VRALRAAPSSSRRAAPGAEAVAQRLLAVQAQDLAPGYRRCARTKALTIPDVHTARSATATWW
jgi:hypothetical protein